MPPWRSTVSRTPTSAHSGEDHGFRKSENILRAFEAELSFLSQVFRFELADDIAISLRWSGSAPGSAVPRGTLRPRDHQVGFSLATDRGRAPRVTHADPPRAPRACGPPSSTLSQSHWASGPVAADLVAWRSPQAGRPTETGVEASSPQKPSPGSRGAATTGGVAAAVTPRRPRSRRAPPWSTGPGRSPGLVGRIDSWPVRSGASNDAYLPAAP